MPDTTLGITYPSTTSAVNVPGDMQVIALDVDALLTLLVNKPRFSVYQSGTAQNITNSLWTTIAFNTEVYDTANGHDTVTNNGRYTVQAGHGGLWMLTGKVSWDGNTTNRRQSRWLLNGVTVVPGSETSAPPATTVGGLPCVTALVPLIAGDYLELQAAQDSGGTRTTFTSNSDAAPWMAGVRLSS